MSKQIRCKFLFTRFSALFLTVRGEATQGKVGKWVRSTDRFKFDGKKKFVVLILKK